MIKLFFVKVLLLPLSLFAIFFPKRNRHFFPSFSHEQWTGNHRVLFELLILEQKNAIAVVPKEYQNKYSLDTVVNINQYLKIIYYALSSRYVYFHHGTSDLPIFIFPFRCKTIMLNHGIHYKKTGASLGKFKLSVLLDSMFISQHFVSSEYDALAVCSNYYKKLKSCKVTGLIRNDLLISNKYDGFYKDDIQLISDIAGEKKVILYAPTWRDFGTAHAFSEEDIRAIEDYCSKNNSLFFYAGHPYLKGRVCPKSEYIIDLFEYKIDLQILLRNTDILITDYSSIWLDALLLEIPVLSFCFDYDSYKNYRGELLPFPDFFPGNTSNSLIEIFDVLSRDGGRQNISDSYLTIKRIFHTFDSDISSKLLGELD